MYNTNITANHGVIAGYVYYNNIIMLCINIMQRWRVAVSIGTQSEYSSLNVTILLYVSLASRFRAHNM